MQNAWRWGSDAARHGYFSEYDRVADAHRSEKEPNYELDYVPLRLAVMTLWAKSRIALNPDQSAWDSSYIFNRPLLRLNSTMEMLSAIAVFLLARQLIEKEDKTLGKVRTWRLRSEWLAMIAFACAWLNVASVVSAHARPTWDVWVTPFFLFAVLLALNDCWLTAGLIIGLGTMFKGQQLIVTPIFLLWTLIVFRIGRAIRFVIGFAMMTGIIVAPWIVPARVIPIAWVLICSLLGPIAYFIAHRVAKAQASEERDSASEGRLRLGSKFAFPARWLRWIIPACIATSLWLCIPFFHSNTHWFDIGFTYGANRFKQLEVGGASSLASILQSTYGWQAETKVEWTQLLGWNATISDVMIALYGVLLIPCAWAMHRYAKAGDRRFLMAMATPWIIYFAFFPKMHERYLLWGAISACAATACGIGPFLLMLVVSFSSCLMSLDQMLRDGRPRKFLADWDPTLGVQLRRFAQGTYPGLGWAIMLAALTWWWIVVAGAFKPAHKPTELLPLKSDSNS